MCGDEFSEEKIGEAGSVVADFALLLQEVSGDVAHAHTFEFDERGLDEFGALGFITAQHLRGGVGAVDDGAIE